MSISGTPTYLHYRLLLRAPTIVSTLSGDADSAATQPSIPGGAIRGALAARLIANRRHGDSEEFRRLILSGQIRFLNAYPELAGDRALPTCNSWKRQKNDNDSAVDLAAYSGVSSSTNPEEFDWPEAALNTVNDPFTSPSGRAKETTRPRINSRLHQQRDRSKGRPWTKRNGQTEERYGVIFPVEYLEADQVFRGVIQIMTGAAGDADRIRELLSGAPIYVGRSRRAGYGGEAELNFTGKAQLEYENVSGSISRDVAAGTTFRAFLASAYIGRHPTIGQIDPCALQQELCRRLDGAATVERTRWTFETVGSFNQKWCLEVPQALAVAAGAVLVLKSTAPISVATMRAVEHDGLGERRVEGFGRVLFLEHSEDDRTFGLTRADPSPIEVSGEIRGSTTKEHRQLEFVEERIVLAAARVELDQIASVDIASKVKNPPNTSLLGRLRTLFRGVTDKRTAEAALANLAIWCGDSDGALKDRARNQLEKCEVLNGNFFEWLRGLARAAAGETGWEPLKTAAASSADRINPLAQKHYLRDKDSAQAHLNRHAAELCVYLIDGTLAALARRNRRKEEKTDE